MARNFYLKKGESTLIRIQTEGSYTIGFTTIPELELGQTTSCLYKTGDSGLQHRLTASICSLLPENPMLRCIYLMGASRAGSVVAHCSPDRLQ